MPWDNTEPFLPPPPPELRWTPVARVSPASQLVPSSEEWAQWRAYAPAQMVCRGKGKGRTCRKVQPSAVDAANTTAVVKPKAIHTAYGQSIQVRYPYDGKGQKVYEIYVSPGEFTRLLLPVEERLAAKLALDPQAWEVSYGKAGAEGARQELIAVRPLQAPQKGRDMILLQSGLTIYLQFLAQERPGMLSVVWEMPEPATAPVPELPLDQRPPTFNSDAAYSGYVVKLEGKSGFEPPWYPKAVVDDGRNTLINLGTAMDGQRMPSVVGIQQNGKPALVASRLYIHPERQQDSAWFYVQGLHPALALKDAAGMSVLITRQVPVSVQEQTHAQR